jgi:FkbM family methyltransferase
MEDQLKFRVRQRLAAMLSGGGRVSFAQGGEDLLLFGLFWLLGVERPTYLDIGTNDPVVLNNTYFFYQRGSRGVCVEPNPALLEKIKARRPGDECVGVGIGIGAESEADFYVLSDSVNSTFSRKAAEQQAADRKQKIERVIRVPLWRTSKIIETCFATKAPDLVSLDTESLDLTILKDFDFIKHRPMVFCVETLEHLGEGQERKNDQIVELMRGNGYMVYADTHINSIFVDETKWAGRLHR